MNDQQQTQVKDKQVDPEWIPEIERSDIGNRLPVAQQFVKDVGISGSQWRVLVDQIFPSAKSVEAIAMALTYCKVRNLDIYKRPVHIVPMYSTTLGKMVETVWPGISEIRTTATRTGQYAGIDAVEFGPIIERVFKDKLDEWVEPEGGGKKVKKRVDVEKTVRYPEWASVVVYRMLNGQKCAYHAKIFWEETYASRGRSDIPNEMWGKRPRGQLDKCVEAAALRKAFPEEVGNDYAAEEMEGRTIEHIPGEQIAKSALPEGAKPPVPPAKDESRQPIQTKPEQTGKPPVPPSKGAETGKPPVPPTKKPEPAKEPEPQDEGQDGQDSFAYEDGVFTEEGEDDQQPIDEDLPGDPDQQVRDTEFLEKLDDDMAEAKDEASLEEIWTEADPMARFEGNDDFQALAMSVRRRHLKRVG